MGSERHPAAAVAAAVWTLVAGLIAMYVVLFVLSAATRLVRPAEEFSYGESWLLDGTRQVARGEGLYQPADQLPMMHIAYTPGYYVVVGELQRVFGDSGYTIGRAVSLLATLIAAAALAWSMQRLTGRRWAGLLAAGLFLTQNMTVLLWAPMHRVDPLALAFTLVGLALATAGRSSLAAVAFLLAVSTKQTFVVAPVVAAIALWPCKRSLARFVAIVGGGSAVVVIVAQWLSQGWFLWHTVTGNSNTLDLFTFSALMGSFMQFNGLSVLAALASLALPAVPGERLWRLYFVGCLLTLPSLAKLGASSNYWLELSAATAALLALASHRLMTWPAARIVAPTMLAGSLLIAVPGYQALTMEIVDAASDVSQPGPSRYLTLVGDSGNLPYRVNASFVQHLAREPGDLLTDNPGLAVAAGKRIQFEFQIFQLLGAEGHWSEQPIIEAINARRFALVALMHPLDGPLDGTRWTPALRTALTRAYAPAGNEGGFWLYRPRARVSDTRPASVERPLLEGANARITYTSPLQLRVAR